LLAAINNVPQGIIMLDTRAVVVAINDRYRKFYGMPPTIKPGSSLEEIVEHSAKSGLFTDRSQDMSRESSSGSPSASRPPMKSF
jgi:PAS domain-containing protein